MSATQSYFFNNLEARAKLNDEAELNDDAESNIKAALEPDLKQVRLFPSFRNIH